MEASSWCVPGLQEAPLSLCFSCRVQFSLIEKPRYIVLRGVRRRQIFVRVVSLAGVLVPASVSEIEGKANIWYSELKL
jgi:hypothetical protein